MQNIVIDKPYQFIPPYRGRFWPWLLTFYLDRHMRRHYGIVDVQCRGVEHLQRSLQAGHGILLTPNHCRDCDPLVLGALARQARTPLFIIASWHVFMQGRLMAWVLRRAGAFSIYREGVDRAAVNAATEILENAERPLVIFPEGVATRTNDHLNALMEGTALIARSAARKRAKAAPPGKVVVHPVAIRYLFDGDLRAAITPVLDEIETRLTWRPSRDLPLIDRIQKVGSALLSLKEIEYIGQPQTGNLHDRLQRLIDHLLIPLENEWTNADHGGTTVARVKRLRAAILPGMANGEIDEPERQRRWRYLADIYLAQQLSHYPPDYLHSDSTPERFLETVERFEEDLTDRARTHSPLRAIVQVAEPIEVQPARDRRDADPLMQQIEQQLKQMLAHTARPAGQSSATAPQPTTPADDKAA